MVTISIYFLKPVLFLQFAFHFHLVWGNLSYFDQKSTFSGWLFFKTYKTQQNIFPNFFSKIATESELIGPQITL